MVCCFLWSLGLKSYLGAGKLGPNSVTSFVQGVHNDTGNRSDCTGRQQTRRADRLAHGDLGGPRPLGQ